MLLAVLIILYLILVTIWAIVSFIIFLFLVKYHFTSLVSWFMVVLYCGISSAILITTLRTFLDLGIQNPFIFY